MKKLPIICVLLFVGLSTFSLAFASDITLNFHSALR